MDGENKNTSNLDNSSFSEELIKQDVDNEEIKTDTQPTLDGQQQQQKQKLKEDNNSNDLNLGNNNIKEKDNNNDVKDDKIKISKEDDDDDLEEGEVKDDDDNGDVYNEETDRNMPSSSSFDNSAREYDSQVNDVRHHESTSHYGAKPRSPDPNMLFPPNQHMQANNHHRYPLTHGPMNHKGPNVYNRGGPSGVGPVMHAKVNTPCRFYSKTRNKCTWGELCRFEHREDNDFETSPSSARAQHPPPPPPPHMQPMGPERPYPPYPSRHQPYPHPPPMAYPYNPYHNSTPPPMMPHHSSPHWRPSNAYPSHPPYAPPVGSPGHAHQQPINEEPPARSLPQLPGISGGGGGSSGPGPNAPGRIPSPGYPSSSSYERKQQLAYEAAPWNDRGGYPNPRYEREPAAPFNRSFYRSQREPYRREPLPPYAYPNPSPYSYPSSYRGPPAGSQAAPYNRFMSSSQRSSQPDVRRTRSTKRRLDEDESSWSDSGSEDSFLGQGNYSKSADKTNQPISESDNRGTGTPPGEPLDDNEQPLLKKLKEVEELIKKKEEERRLG